MTRLGPGRSLYGRPGRAGKFVEQAGGGLAFHKDQCVAEFVRVAGDQAGTAFAGEVGPEPTHQNEQAVSEADEEKYMKKQPEQPGDDAAKFHAEYVSDGTAPADGGHRPFIDVLE